jgi:hypothetical protein
MMERYATTAAMPIKDSTRSSAPNISILFENSKYTTIERYNRLSKTEYTTPFLWYRYARRMIGK